MDPITTPAPERPAWQVGDYITWPGNPDCYRLVHVGRFAITYEARDGVRQEAEETALRTLAQDTADWRPATPEQIARHQRLYRPAPSNWE
ncbi:hypothetical protein ACPCSP_25595 [Streptomyces cinereoruber]|uniref:hypothetical protein n=1 Tax=Streptomyces cinereoruber TaxID=67260 RepID=UPI003C2D66D4